MTDPKGIKTTIIHPTAKKPCEDCTLVAMNGGVQYANGTDAVMPAIYLHHAAIINVGPEAKDGTCARPAYDLFFSTGNERSTIIYNNPNATQQAGYYIKSSDNFVLQSEVINNELEDKDVWIYMNYEYIPGKVPGHQQTKVIWLSTEGKPCERKSDLNTILGSKDQTLGAGEMYPPSEKAFSLKSQTWISPWSGNFVALGRNSYISNYMPSNLHTILGGHVHDGGVNTEIYQNGKLICDSRATYGVINSSSMGGGHSPSNSRHLVSMSGCRSIDAVKTGDKFYIVVNYDFDKNPG